ncbi:O-antigen ligase family protein [Micromonospora craterilacus]|uniref:O-antigen ligase family protein n=1 Tax=Micromonospora craterilacus TaxID=1655439 RepID=UPI0011B4A291|nr:O-antigen ligase family protein [Micromonospora craterilacus]
MTLLLVGTLIPARGIPVVTLTAAMLVPVLLWAVVTGLPVVHRAVRFAVVLAAVVAVPAFVTPPTNDYGSTKVSSFFLFTVPTAVAVMLLRDRRDVTTWAKVWVVSGCLLAIFALVGGVDPAGRAVGSDGASNPIWLARAIGSPAVALLWLTYRRALPRPVVIGAAVLLVAGLYATGSRGPVLALAIATLVVITLASPAARASRAAVVGLAAGIGGYFAVVFQWIPAASRFGAALYDPQGELEASQRVELARPTIDLIMANPGGVGFGHWADHAAIVVYRYPHNLFLEVFAEAGWIPGAVLVALLLWVVVRLWRSARVEPAAVLTLALLAFETMCVSVSGDLNARTFFAVLTLGYVVSHWPVASARPVAPDLSRSGWAAMPVGASGTRR